MFLLQSTYAIHIAAHGGGESWNSLHDARMKDASGRTVVVLNVPNGMTKSDMARAFREFRLLPGSNGCVVLMPDVVNDSVMERCARFIYISRVSMGKVYRVWVKYEETHWVSRDLTQQLGNIRRHVRRARVSFCDMPSYYGSC